MMSREPQLHEDYGRHDDIKVGSERGFGVVFAVVFGVIALWPLLNGEPIRNWAAAVGAVFLLLALAYPPSLRPLNLLWFRLGMVMYKVVNPVVMALLYFTTVVPTGVLMRLFGKDPMNLKFDPAAKSYWITREPAGPEPETMKNQF